MNRRLLYPVAIIALICVFSLVFSAKAQRQAEQSGINGLPRTPRRMEDFDIRATLDRTLPDEPTELRISGVRGRSLIPARDSRLRREHPAAQMRFSSLTGAPSRVYSLTGELTAPTGTDAESTARQFLKRNDDLYRLRGEEVDGLRATRRYRTEHNGLTHLTLQQQVGGIEVFQGDYVFHLDRNGALIAASGELIPSAAGLINATQPRLSANAALRKAAEYADTELPTDAAVKSPASEKDQRQRLNLASKFAQDVEARLVYFPLTGGQLRLAWEFTLWLQEAPDVYQMVVDADNGALLYRDNLTWYCFESGAQPEAVATGTRPVHTYRAANRSLPRAVPSQTAPAPHGLVFTRDSPRPDSPHTSANPPFVDREDVPFRTMPFNGAAIFAANDPHNDWWAGESPTLFTSNNADAYLDRNANNQPDDSPRVTVADSNFSFPIDFTQQPTTDDNQKSALVNVFYWTNRYHDILYSFGFNEAAGNFQTNNFGLGGVGNDAVRAEAQDGSGTNNANFSTSNADGSTGRMQMYLFTGGAIQRDGDLEQGIVLHELTHGTSTRLVRNLSFAQGGGMGEGWSDYFALALMRGPQDDLDGSYPVGGFAVNDFVNGIRRFPYSTSSTVYPLNFGDIAQSTEVHNVGEIWCNSLLEMRAALIRKLGFQEGQRQSLQLVVDGMKLTAAAPTFLDARNGIMLADKVNNGGANQCTMWQAFAKRGMGFSASTLDARDGAPQQEFDLPPFCSDLGAIRFDQKAYLLGETIQIALGDHNATGTVRVKVKSSVTGDEETLTLSADGTFAGSYHASLRVAPGTAAPGDGVLQASLAARDKILVSYDDANNGSGAAASVMAQTEVAGEKAFFDDAVETGNLGWSVTGAPANTWAISEAKAASGTHAWTDSPNGNYAAGTNASLVSPLLDLSRAVGVSLTFAHAYALTTGFDYGVVEYSMDDGASWKRATAFTGSQTSFTQALLKLDVLAGQARARIRFRLSSTAPVTADGWTIDDIRVIARSSDPAFIPPPSALAPILTGISPAFGPPSGNTPVTISGLNFTEAGDVKVFFNGVAAGNVRALGSTSITASTPPLAAGKASLRIETRYGGVTLANAFTYYVNGSATGSPDVTNLVPASGSIKGGTVVTINGANFTPETTVLFGAQTAARTFINANTLRATSPAAAATGAVDVTIRNSTAQEKTLAGGFNYTAPTPPSVAVLTPNGGERVFTGSTITLRWQSSDNHRVARHRIALYRSTGATPQPFANIAEVGGEAQSFNWTIPATAATSVARLRVLAIDDEGAETEAFSSADFTIESRWAASTQLPTPLNRTAITGDGQYLYTVAGRSNTSNTSSITTLQRLDPAAGTPVWEPLASLPAPFNSGKAVTINGRIYVPGGINPIGEIERNQYVYDIAGNTWATLAAPPTGVHAYSLAADAAHNLYYVTGGSDGVVAGFTNVQAYDIPTNKWTALPPMNTARFAHESVLANGKLYVAGGIGAPGSLVSGEVFDFATQKWSPIADLPRVHQYTTSALATDTTGRLLWLIIGGEDANGTPIGAIDAYDFASNQWITLDGSYDLPTARTRLGSTTLGGFVYAIGGLSPVTGGTTTVRTVERFKLDGFAILSPNQPPLVAVPVTPQIALPGRELTFVVSAQDLGSGVPIAIAAAGLPNGASFNVTNDTNNSARGTFKWTPAAEDAGRSLTINFTASDGLLTDVKSVQVSVVQASALAAVNAADFRIAPLAADSIAAAFGTGLAARTEIAQSAPLPLTLADTMLTVNGIPAPLFFVSPNQINFVVPTGVDIGSASIIVSNALGNYAAGNLQIVAAAPALFTADATGKGDAAAQATADGVNYQPPPFDVTIGGRPNILVLYGTGIRHAPAANPNDNNGVAESVSITIDGQPANVLYAGAQGSFAGLDQINVELPSGLAGQGQRRVDVVVTVAGVAANRVTIQIK